MPFTQHRTTSAILINGKLVAVLPHPEEINLAKKSSRGRATRKMKDKWKSKEWYKLLAPDMFEGVVLGETPADEPGKVLGRSAEVTVHELTGDFSKMHIKMMFKVDEINGYNAYTKFTGHTLTSDYLRRLVRRKKSKMDAILDVRTKDGYVVRLMPAGISDHRIQSSQKSALRKIMVDESAKYASAHTLSEVLKAIVDSSLQKEISKGCKAIYPIRKIEFMKSEVLQEPAGAKRLRKHKTVEVGEEGEEAPTEEVEATEEVEKTSEEKEDLTQIPGVGPQKAKLLHESGFLTVDSIKNAKSEDLEKVEGLGPALVKKILDAAKEL